MSRVEKERGQPRAMVHRRILDVAESQPEATLEEIAEKVSTATQELVEQVLEDYGDPGNEDAETTETTETEPMTQNGQTASETDEPTGTEYPDAESLSPKQRETLQLVHENPDRTQVDIADTLGVSRATVSRRLNDISGFEWQDRNAFTRAVFDGAPGSGESLEIDDADDAPEGDDEMDAETGDETDKERDAEAGDGTDDDRDAEAGDRTNEETGGQVDVDERLAEFDKRLGALEASVDGGQTATVGLPPELAHKVVHACMESDRISEDEELQLLKAVLAE
jgi:DNA-binding CsgD family transcriptional regulator